MLKKLLIGLAVVAMVSVSKVFARTPLLPIIPKDLQNKPFAVIMYPILDGGTTKYIFPAVDSDGQLIVKTATSVAVSSVSVTNFPSNQSVTITNDVLKVSSTDSIVVSNLPANQSVSISGSSNTVSVDNFPNNQNTTITNDVVKVTSTDTITINNIPENQSVSISGSSNTVNVSNFPSNQDVTVTNQFTTTDVSGTVSVSNLPESQSVKIDGSSNTVSVNNFPSIQAVTVSNDATFHTVESSNTWVYISSAVTNSPSTILLGAGLKGKSYSVKIKGGDAIYNINSGTDIEIKDTEKDSEEFLPFLIDNPTINVTSLSAGATIQVKITGGSK